MKNMIVMEVGAYKYAILEPTPENLGIAAALANVPLFESNGEWDAKKLVYRQVSDASVKVEIKPVRISREDDVFVEAARVAKDEANTKRYAAEAAKAAAEKERDAIRTKCEEYVVILSDIEKVKKERDEARAELEKVKAAMVEAGVSVSYPKE